MSRNALTLIGAVVLGAMVMGAGVALAGFASTGAPAAAAASPPDNGTPRTIAVSANGEVGTNPDKAVIRVSIEASADDPTVARRQVAENASEMRSALAEIGINESAIRTVDFNIYEDRERPPERDGEPRTVYRARHSFAIEVDDTGQVGTAIDTAVDSGATSVHDVQFTLAEETRRELRKQALSDAMSNARGQAGTLAEAAGLRVTGVNTVSTVEVDFPHRRVEFAAANAGGGGTDIESGPVTVTATVTVTYNASAR